jgi:hypothetical protein
VVDRKNAESYIAYYIATQEEYVFNMLRSVEIYRNCDRPPWDEGRVQQGLMNSFEDEPSFLAKETGEIDLANETAFREAR